MSTAADDRRELQRERIIDATWRVVRSGGFESLTMRELASELGLAHGAVKYYFPSKRELLVAALQRTLDRSRERERAVIGDARGLVFVRRFALQYFPQHEDSGAPSAVVVASWGRVSADDTYHAMLAGNNSRLRRIMRGEIEHARAAGELGVTAPDSEQVADLLTAIVTGSQPIALLLPEESRPERLVKMLDAYLDVIASPSGLAGLRAERLGSSAAGAAGGD